MLRRRRIILLLLVLLVSLGLVITGCSYDKPADYAAASKASEIKVGLDIDAQTMDPRLARDTSSWRAIELVYDGLVRLDNNLTPQPDLAESWDNPNPTTWVFHLRKGVTWHDGQPFTAEDVKYTFDSILDPGFKAPYAKLYAPIKKIEVVDPNTVKFTLDAPYAPLLSYMDMGIVPKHIGEKNDNSLSSKPVGTGPYKFVQWDKKSKIIFEANDKYFGGAPKTPKVTYFIIPDNTARVAALEAGDVDFVHSPLSPQDIPRIKGNSKFTVEETTALGFTYLNFNTSSPLLSDIKVRQAIAHLVDKNALSTQVYQGMDKPGKSPLLPGTWAYTDKIDDYTYDPAQAKSLLAEDGWKDADGDGVLEKNGQKLSITLSTHSEDPNRVQAVQYLQNVFNQAGIQTKVSITEWPTFNSNVMAGKYDIALLGWLNLVDPDRAMYTQFVTNEGNNWGKYSNATVDTLLKDARATMDQKARAKMYEEAAQIVTRDVVYDVILYQGYVVMHSKKLTGFKPNPKGSLYGLKDVVVEK